MRLAGITFDIYDDQGASLDRDMLKTAGLSDDTSMLSQEELDRLPDRLFAFVATNAGEPIRKYAMHDGPNVVLSSAYFLAHLGNLPQELHSKIASNLVNAHAWYDLSPAEDLVKLSIAGAAMTALNVGLTGMQAMGEAGVQRGRHRQDMDAFRAAQSSGAKVADLNGTDAMSASGPSTKPKTNTLPLTTNSKTAWAHCGEISHLKVSSPREQVEDTHYAFPHLQRYPITTVGQLKVAMDYFDQNYYEFRPLERRVYAQAVDERAQELGVKVAGRIAQYTGDTCGPHTEAELFARARAFENTEIGGHYASFYEKRAALEPEVLAAGIDLLDTMAFPGGLHRGLRDAYAAVYEDSVKTASEDVPGVRMWEVGADMVSDLDLAALAKRPTFLDKQFGEGFGLKFVADPSGTFLSLPPATRYLLARMARAAT